LTTAASPGALGLATDAEAPAISGMRLYRPALWFALMVTTGLAVAYRADLARGGKAVLGLGVLHALAACYIAFARPRHFPLLLIAYLPYNTRFPVNLGSSSLNLTNILVLMGIVAMLSTRRPRRQPFGGLEYVLLAFIGFGVLAIGTTIVGHGGRGLQTDINHFKQWLTPILVFFLARRVIEDREDLVDVLVAILWTSTLVGALTWWEGFTNVRGSIDRSRVGSIMSQANTMAAFLVYYSLPALALFLRLKHRGARALSLAAFLVMARGMLYCLSRGAYLSLAAGSVVVMLLSSPLLLVAGATSVVVAIAAPEYAPDIIPSSVLTRMKMTTKTDETDPDASTDHLDTSSEHRLMLWNAGLAMMRAHPLAGVGLFRYGEVIDKYALDREENDPFDAHEAYIKVGAEMGIPALLTMLLLLAWIGCASWTLYFRRTDLLDRSLALGMMGSLVGLMVSCLFGSRFVDDNLMSQFWVLVGSMRVLRYLPERVEPAERTA
jgi:O-Antigen ligase